MEDITDAYYAHVKRICQDFEIKKKKIGEYHDLYVQSDTLLLADVFENFRNVCLKMHKLDSCKNSFSSWISMSSSFKKD